MKPIFLALALALALPLSGCLAGDGDSDTDDADTTGSTSGSSTRSTTRTGTTVSASGSAGPVSGNATVGGNTTGNQTGNATGNQTGNSTGNATWSYDNRTGTISGTAVPVVAGSFSEEETFTIANGTQKLVLNLTADGRAITMNVQEPDCDDTDCGTEVETAEGKATISFNSPAEGEWTVTLTISGGTGPVTSDYVLSIGTLGNGTADP